jgi:hypothetical protein
VALDLEVLQISVQCDALQGRIHSCHEWSKSF